MVLEITKLVEGLSVILAGSCINLERIFVLRDCNSEVENGDPELRLARRDVKQVKWLLIIVIKLNNKI